MALVSPRATRYIMNTLRWNASRVAGNRWLVSEKHPDGLSETLKYRSMGKWMTCFVLWVSRRANSHIQIVCIRAGRLLDAREAAWCSSQQPQPETPLHAVRFPNIAPKVTGRVSYRLTTTLPLTPTPRPFDQRSIEFRTRKTTIGSIFDQRAISEVRTGNAGLKLPEILQR